MSTFPRSIIASLAVIIMTAGLAPAPARPTAELNAQSARAALSIWNDSLSLVSTTTVASQNLPTPTPAKTPVAPAALNLPHQAATSGSKCPTTADGSTNVSINTTGPNADVNIHCSVTSSRSSSSTTNVSVTSSSHQTSTGGTNNSSSSTNISITSE